MEKWKEYVQCVATTMSPRHVVEGKVPVQPRDERGRFAPHEEQICNDCGVDLLKIKRMPKSWGRVCRKCGQKRERKRYWMFKEEMERDVGRLCEYCGGMYTDFHHVVPIWNHTRSHMRRNKDILVPTCRPCHVVWHNLKEWLDLEVM